MSCDFSNVYYEADPNSAFTLFYDKLFKLYEKSFPLKKKKIKSNAINEPWVTPKLKKCIQKKYKLFNLLRRGKIQRTAFLKYKKVLSWVTKKIKDQYYNNKFKDSMDAKTTWQNINKILNRKNKHCVKRLIDDNGRNRTGVDMVNYFNSYFSSVAADMTRDLPVVEENNSFLINSQSVTESCVLFPTNIVEVSDILNSMPNKGNSLYDIKPKILNIVSEVILPLIVYLYNLCVLKGVYPNILKVARIVPIFKSGSMTKVNNYRPISNLSSLNKIFELLTATRMNNFIAKHSIISDIQYGFRKSCSTSLAIFNLMNDFIATFNDESFTIALFLDLRKAFDVVDRNILINKLYFYIS